MSEWIVLAHVLRPQGRKGEVLAELLTDFPESFTDRENLYLAPEEFTGEATQSSAARGVSVVSYFLPVGRQQGRIVLQLGGVESIEAAEALAGLDIITPAGERLPLDEAEAEVYISDLIGCTVVDDGMPVGIVDDVTFATTPDGGRRLEDAAPVLSVHTAAGDEVLIPFVKAFLVRHDVEAKRLEMKLPEGLVDVYLSKTAARSADAEEIG